MFLGTVLTNEAVAVAPACGTVITTSTTLTADVGPCNTRHGLIVRGNNIVLDLNGHRVFSTAPLPRNSGVDENGIYLPSEVVGIRIQDSTNVLVRNGTVEGFAAGVSIEGGSSNVVQNITAQNNQAPCIGEDFSTFAVGIYGDGIVVFSSTNNRILNNRIRNNGPFSGVALVANTMFITRALPPYPSGNVVSGNLIEDNNTCFADIGVRLEGPGATNNRITSNTIRRSFQEGIVVHPVNVINFEPLFQNPPQCQNRGFPRPDLPLCPIQDPLNPTNDNNVIQSNIVSQNGFGGAQGNPGPDITRQPSPQSAAGINLLAFCGYGARSNSTGNVITGNQSTGNAGHGINVGGCPLGQDPARGTFPGYTNTQIIGNTSVGNNAAGCGVLPVAPGCGGRPTTPRFDLHDGTHEIVCPSTNASNQAICAGLGFPAPPGGTTPFVGTPVIQPGGTPCDNNFWWGNRYGTAFPPCTTAGGQQISASQVPTNQGRVSGSSSDSGTSGPDPAAYPLRGFRAR